MGKSIEIRFANTSGVFFPGGAVEGNVVITVFKKPMKIRGLKLKFKGKAFASWSEKHGDTKTTYKAKQIYFKEEMLLYGIWPGQGSDTTDLAEGCHTFPFKLELPDSLPSSFEHIIGYVRYNATCIIDKPWTIDVKIERPFTVVSILDLISEKEFSEPVTLTKQKHLCCCCCKSGPITAEFHIDRLGWVPGEAIKLYANISNATSRQIEMSKVTLIMTTIFHAKGAHKMVMKEIACVKRPSIAGFGEDTWTGEELVIPPLPPSCLLGCDLIDVNYSLQLAVIPEFAMELVLPLPLVIGTIPLRSVIEQTPPMAPLPPIPISQSGTWADPSALSGNAVYPPLPITIPNLQSPSYISGGLYDVKYRPLYPFYNFGHLPPGLTK